MRIANHLQTEQRHRRVLATNQERRRINDDIQTPEARLHADAERELQNFKDIVRPNEVKINIFL